MTQHWLIWIPRILAILLGLFLVLFSIDVFGGDDSIWHQLLGFLIHNIPALVWFLILWLTWKRPLIAGLLFLALCAAFTIFFHTYQQDWSGFLLISGAPLLIGILFLISHFLAKKQA
ncbi:MAG: hypothetical protein PHD87_01695 [Candidatus Cloacimonetes bacterium]|nr:hypothetical protein [Candidatus Cloacimonadota bacterium]